MPKEPFIVSYDVIRKGLVVESIAPIPVRTETLDLLLKSVREGRSIITLLKRNEDVPVHSNPDRSD